MSPAELIRARRYTPLGGAAIGVILIARLWVPAIDEAIPVNVAIVLSVLLLAPLVFWVLSTERRIRARLNELRDPISGELLPSGPLPPIATATKLRLLGIPLLSVGVIALALAIGHGVRSTCIRGHQGLCSVDATLAGGGVTYNNVDAGTVLRMPGYTVSLRATSTAQTAVTGAGQNSSLYANGTGILVCLLLTVTNSGTSALSPDPGGTAVNLILQDLNQPPSHGSLVRELPNANGEPHPSLADLAPLAAGQSETGWVAFVAPSWTLQTLHAPTTDLEIFQPDGQRNYIGEIRLWKADTSAGYRALAMQPPA